MILALHNGISYVNNYLPRTNAWLVLAASVPVALACGTLFAYSVYSTQLAERCHLTTSQSANLNISVTIGSSIGGIIGGFVTDIYGTQLPQLLSTLCIFFGYRTLYILFQRGPVTAMWQLVLTMTLIGVGTTSGYFSAIKAVTIEFPNLKATAQSITIAFFAISGLVFSLICSDWFHGNVSQFLYFLHVSCGLMAFIGFIFIRVPGHVDHGKVNDHEIEEEAVDEATALLPSRSRDSAAPKGLHHLALVPSLKHPIFWFHFTIFSISQGLGQMYIYSVGFIVKAVFIYYTQDDSRDLEALTRLQAIHVSLIAVFSFIGRLASGPASDYVVNILRFQRHWILLAGLSVMLAGHLLSTVNFQFGSLHTANLFLALVSSLIGFAYGFSFTCYPAIIADIFNMRYYSFVWGIMYSATIFGLTVMTKIFGLVYDANSTKYDEDTHSYICEAGVRCYALSFEITAGLCLGVMVLILLYIKARH